MVDVSGIEWNWWASFAWWLVPVVVSATIGAIASWLAETRTDGWKILSNIMGVIFSLWIFLGAFIFMVAIPAQLIGNQERDLITAQLTEMGYSHVDLEGKRGFTASNEGQYVEAVLHDRGDNRYQVIEVPLD